MRRIEFDAEFDAVINMFTAFGYFADEAENRLVLERVAAALAPGGAFLLETINPVSVFPRFEARGWHELSDGTVMLEERFYDAARGRFETTLDVHERRRPPPASLLPPGLHGARADGDDGRRGARGRAAVGRARRVGSRKGSRRIVMLARRMG